MPAEQPVPVGPQAAHTGPQAAMLECRELDVEVGDRVLVRGLHLSLRAGSVLAILGPNGCGKSLSLHTLAGLRPPKAGEIAVLGRRLADWPRRALAQVLAMLPQNIEDPFPATVLETVLLGRHPHIARWQWESARDLAIASDALASVGLSGHAERDVMTLSGGERRRAALAAVIAQTPRLFLLDEPTSQLDPNHQLEALELLRARADAGAAVIVTLHDANLAARFADEALLIGKRGAWQFGPAATILSADNLSTLFDTRFEAANCGGRRVFFQA